MSKQILFLTPQLPYPPHQGTTLRNFGLIKGLAEKGHTISLLSFVESGQPAVDDTPLAALCEQAAVVPSPTRGMQQRLRDLIAGHADMARRLWSEEFQDALRDLLTRQHFDVIHLEGIEMVSYLPEIQQNSGADTLLIYDAHNAEYALQKRVAMQDFKTPRRWPAAIYSLIQTRRLTRLETALCAASDHVLACSEADAASLRSLTYHTPVTVAPNAITTGQYHQQVEPAALVHPALVFTGKMDYRPNVDAALWFADEILPLIREAVPEAHFTIVGKNPHPRLAPLQARPDVTLTGFVPEILPYLKAADVYVAPLRMGSGTRFKLLEAMAAERVVVSTRVGAEGLALEDGGHLLLADTAADFAAAVAELLGDERRRAALIDQAAQVVRENYDWKAIIPLVEAAYG